MATQYPQEVRRTFQMTDSQLVKHIERLAYLAGTSEETDEYCSLMGRIQAARDDLNARRTQVQQP